MNARPARFAPFALVGLLALCACQEGSHHPTSSEKAMAAPKEAEALALLMAVDDYEIKAAEDARDKSDDPAVKDYAAMLDAAHTQHRKDAKAVAKAAGLDADDTPKVDALQDQLKRERANLDGLKGAAYDRAYVDAMVKGHQDVLDLIDHELMAGATTPAVRQHLSITRQHIAQHLDEAKRLRDRLHATSYVPASQLK